MDTKIIVGYPPNYELILGYLKPKDNAVFAHGEAIYNPSGALLEPDLLLHESLHLERQKSLGVDRWWNTYLTDKDFRLEEEVIAYAAQYAYGLKTYRRKIADQMLTNFAMTLSGEMYALDVPYQKAENMIRLRAKAYL